MVQRHQRLRLHRARGGGKDVFVHISAVERSGLTGLADNQKVTYDLEAGRDGRESAVNLQVQ
jgi:CspA family cold shock protein